MTSAAVSHMQAGPQGNMMALQAPQASQAQGMGMQHQPVSSAAASAASSLGQVVQGQTGGPAVTPRPQLGGQAQMVLGAQSPGMGPHRGMTPPRQVAPQQGQVVSGQVILLQQNANAMMEQIASGQMQGNKPSFGVKGQPGAMQGQIMRGPAPNMQASPAMFQGQIVQSQQVPSNGGPAQTMALHAPQMRLPGGHHMVQQQQQQLHQLQQLQQLQQQKQQQQPQLMTPQQPPHGDASGSVSDMPLQQMVPEMQAQAQQPPPPPPPPQQPGIAVGMPPGSSHFPATHGLPFNPQFAGQMTMGGQCGQAGGFPGNKDVTLTSPLLVNLLQSDISASQFGPGGKQAGAAPAKPKKKKPPRKKKGSTAGGAAGQSAEEAPG